nr:hypothetical protein [Tanacetum cinerariifolium]
MPKVLSLAWETILEIDHALEDKHCQPKDILELFRRLNNDMQNIHEELAVYINTSSWDRPTICYNDDDDEDCTIAIIPIVSTKEPDNSLSAHYCYNCPLKVPIIPNLEPYNNQTIYEPPQTLPSFYPTCYSGDGNSFTYDSKSNLADDSPNVFNPHPQPPTYLYEFYGNDAYYGHDFPLQVPFTYDPEPCYNQDFNFSQKF